MILDRIYDHASTFVADVRKLVAPAPSPAKTLAQILEDAATFLEDEATRIERDPQLMTTGPYQIRRCALALRERASKSG